MSAYALIETSDGDREFFDNIAHIEQVDDKVLVDCYTENNVVKRQRVEGGTILSVTCED